MRHKSRRRVHSRIEHMRVHSRRRRMRVRRQRRCDVDAGANKADGDRGVPADEAAAGGRGTPAKRVAPAADSKAAEDIRSISKIALIPCKT
jgi:hypothetical protein